MRLKGDKILMVHIKKISGHKGEYELIFIVF